MRIIHYIIPSQHNPIHSIFDEHHSHVEPYTHPQEKYFTFCYMLILWIFGILFLCFHWDLPYFPRCADPTPAHHFLIALDSYTLGQTLQNAPSCIPPAQYLYLMLIVSSCESIAVMVNLIIGTTLSPNPKQVKQYIWPLNNTFWSSHDSCVCN